MCEYVLITLNMIKYAGTGNIVELGHFNKHKERRPRVEKF